LLLLLLLVMVGVVAVLAGMWVGEVGIRMLGGSCMVIMTERWRRGARVVPLLELMLGVVGRLRGAPQDGGNIGTSRDNNSRGTSSSRKGNLAGESMDHFNSDSSSKGARVVTGASAGGRWVVLVLLLVVVVVVAEEVRRKGKGRSTGSSSRMVEMGRLRVASLGATSA
jgi:hypothetical protein